MNIYFFRFVLVLFSLGIFLTVNHPNLVRWLGCKKSYPRFLWPIVFGLSLYVSYSVHILIFPYDIVLTILLSIFMVAGISWWVFRKPSSFLNILLVLACVIFPAHVWSYYNSHTYYSTQTTTALLICAFAGTIYLLLPHVRAYFKSGGKK